MKFRILFLVLVMIPFLGIAQEKKIVQKKYPDGTPSLIIILNAKGEKVKEISYHKNGKVDYEGTFKDGMEHGIWTYFYEDGAKRYTETWKNGQEEGNHYEYHPNGKLKLTEVYKQGKLVKTIEPE